jgi:phosphatidate cytidylyltransferase
MPRWRNTAAVTGGSGASDGRSGIKPRRVPPMSELQLRVVSAIVLAVLAIGSAWLGGMVFVLVWGIMALIVVQEWMTITRIKPGFAFWGSAGIVYAAALFFSVLALRGDARFGLAAIFFLFAIVWATDVFAYFAGRAIGGPKLAPRISPKKTWSGMIGGVVGGIAAGLLLLMLFSLQVKPVHALLAGALSLASVGGDLFESAFKRKFNVKDSGTLIPGHGGFMDRLDGFIFAAALGAAIGITRAGTAGAATGLLDW